MGENFSWMLKSLLVHGKNIMVESSLYWFETLWVEFSCLASSQNTKTTKNPPPEKYLLYNIKSQYTPVLSNDTKTVNFSILGRLMQKVSIASFLDDAIRLTSRTIYWSTVGQLLARVALCILQSVSKVSFDGLQYSSDVTYLCCLSISYSTVMIFTAA